MLSMALAPLFLAAAPLAGPPGTTTFDTIKDPAEQQVDSESQADDVRFKRDDSDRMTVAVRLSGNGPYRFLVDTGADRTAVSSAVAGALGLVSGEVATLHTMTGQSSVQTATLPELQISQKTVRIVDAPVLEAEHMGADGILGTDSLRSQRVILDFDKKIMTIVPSEQEAARDTGSIVVTGRLRNGRLIVTNALADGNSITVVLDTGSEVSVGNSALRRRLVNRGQIKSGGAVELESVTGEMLAGEYTFVKHLEIGDVGMSNLAVVFADAHTFKRLGLSKRPALLLGMNALRAFKKVSIDFANKKLRVVLPDTGSIDLTLMASR